jgi:hypothetical protein
MLPPVPAPGHLTCAKDADQTGNRAHQNRAICTRARRLTDAAADRADSAIQNSAGHRFRSRSATAAGQRPARKYLPICAGSVPSVFGN